jgi:peptidoglycan hydrolase CwlO-like protein
MAVETRAARNREAMSDARFDAEVALKTELEALRGEARDQVGVIDRLRAELAEARREMETSKGKEDDSAEIADRREITRLTAALAKAESDLAAVHAAESDVDNAHARLRARVTDIEAERDAAALEIAKLRAALKTREEGEPASPGIAQKAEISSLQAEIEEQQRTIAAMKAEIGENQERLLRQAQHFRDELRRLGGERESASAAEANRRSLAERLSGPRGTRVENGEGHAAAAEQAPTPAEQRPAAFLRAIKGDNAAPGDAATPPPVPANDAANEKPGPRPIRRPRLLERISGIDKN